MIRRYRSRGRVKSSTRQDTLWRPAGSTSPFTVEKPRRVCTLDSEPVEQSGADPDEAMGMDRRAAAERNFTEKKLRGKEAKKGTDETCVRCWEWGGQMVSGAATASA